MRQKINHHLIGMSIGVVIATVICVTMVYYALFQRQVRSDLRAEAEVLQVTGIEPLLNDEAQEEMSLRLTLIDADGTVRYDNDTDSEVLENHGDRPEFQEARAEGEGESVRRSDTMGKVTFYYAVRLDDGSVLRLSTDVNSIFSVFITVFPLILLIVLVIILVSALVAHLLTRQILAPIDKMAQNLEDTAHMPVYEELVPFVNTIREQHDNILSAAKSRQDFTANVTHELKTPLTAISGYAELIENHMVNEEQEADFARQIRENADRLVSLINDIIRLSELDNAASDELTFEEMDLYDVVQGCMDLLQVSADKKNVHLSLTGEPCPMKGNRAMVQELIENLCQNAISYNVDDGRVDISVTMEADRPLLVVSDTGIGIPKDLTDRVFERFFRVDKSRSKETGGTGLGLAIVKHIVELHDAEISLDSDVGKGTTIQVRF